MEASSPHKWVDHKFAPYVAQQTPREADGEIHLPLFTKLKARLFKDEELARYLCFPVEINKLLGKETTTWCKFHKTHGHDIERVVFP